MTFILNERIASLIEPAFALITFCYSFPSWFPILFLSTICIIYFPPKLSNHYRVNSGIFMALFLFPSIVISNFSHPWPMVTLLFSLFLFFDLYFAFFLFLFVPFCLFFGLIANLWDSLIFLLFNIFSFKTLIFCFPGSFSIAEASLLVQSLCFMIMKKGDDSTMELYNLHVLQNAVVFGMIFIGIFGYPLLRSIFFSYNRFPSNYMFLSYCFYFYCLCMVLMIRYLVITFGSFDMDPFLWAALHFINYPYMLCLWAFCLLITILFCIFWHFNIGFHKSDIMIEIARKFFHFNITLMILPGIIHSVEFLYIALACVLSLEIFLEILRIFKVWIPFVNPEHFNEFMLSLTRKKKSKEYHRPWDMGVIILSHIYLVLGCSLPFWLTRSYQDPLIKGTGVILIGVADSCASIFGKIYGKTKWVNSGKKSVEGSFAAFMSCILILLLLSRFVLIRWDSVIVLGLSIVLEAISIHNDNILLPLFATGFFYINIALFSNI